MNPALRQLVPAIVGYVTQHGGYVTKTKLLKLLFLCDVEYYRIHRTTLTSFEWKFFHLGPWAREFDPLLDELVAHGVLSETPSSRPEFDTKFYKSLDPADLITVLGTYKEAAPVKLVLDTWGDSSTREILDYVYFHTEPMEYGIRYEPLDFTRIPQQPLLIYARQPSGKTSREIEAARRKFFERAAAHARKPEATFDFTPPRYDEEFFTAVAKLDSKGS